VCSACCKQKGVKGEWRALTLGNQTNSLNLVDLVFWLFGGAQEKVYAGADEQLPTFLEALSP